MTNPRDDGEGQMTMKRREGKHIQEVMERYAPSGFDPASDDMTIEFAILLSEKDRDLATLSRQLAEAQRQRDDYAEMWESNAMVAAAAADRALTAEKRLAEAQEVIEALRWGWESLSSDLRNGIASDAPKQYRMTLSPPREQHPVALRRPRE